MGSAAGTLGSAPTMTAEGPAAAEGLATAGPAAAMSVAEESTAAGEGSTIRGEGPWHTSGLKE